MYQQLVIFCVIEMYMYLTPSCIKTFTLSLKTEDVVLQCILFAFVLFQLTVQFVFVPSLHVHDYVNFTMCAILYTVFTVIVRKLQD